MDKSESQSAESFLTDAQREQSEAREVAYQRSHLGKWNRKDGTLLFHLDSELISTEGLEKLSAGQMVRKPEYHVTLLGRPAGKEITRALKALPEDTRAAVTAEVGESLQNINREWTVDQRIWKIQKDYPAGPNPEEEPAETRSSYIQMVEFNNLKNAIDRMNTRLGLQIEIPPTHITLMTGSTNPKHMAEGIGILTQSALEKLHPEVVWPEGGEQ